MDSMNVSYVSAFDIAEEPIDLALVGTSSPLYNRFFPFPFYPFRKTHREQIAFWVAKSIESSDMV